MVNTCKRINLNNMEITLSHSESEDIFYRALCNAVGTGYMNGYGIELTTDEKQYDEARAQLLTSSDITKEAVCYEDVLMQILRMGGSLTFVDHEGEGEMDSTIKLEDVHRFVEDTEPHSILNFINENDDAEDADAVLQTVFWKQQVFA
jgi:hypothetical protein